MMTNHSGPARLRRWGMELSTYLPHLKVAYRKGKLNGIADYLSRGLPTGGTSGESRYPELPHCKATVKGKDPETDACQADDLPTIRTSAILQYRSTGSSVGDMTMPGGTPREVPVGLLRLTTRVVLRVALAAW